MVDRFAGIREAAAVNSGKDVMRRLLLHVCCGPCATAVLDTLGGEYEVTGFFYNPNLDSEGEYLRRRDAAETVCRWGGARWIEGAFEPERFRDAITGLEREPENGGRCAVCYRLRLEETARRAIRDGYDLFATTLTVGPRKPAPVINPLGMAAAERAGVEFLAGDWKKKDGFRRSCVFSRELGIYRQQYCGCEFSRRGNADAGKRST